MLSTEARLALFYVGIGFVILLGWTAAAAALVDPIDGRRRHRHRRAASMLSVAGLLHPALALGARDITVQIGHVDDDSPDPASRRAVHVANTMVALSIGVAVLILASHTDQLAGSEPFQSVRSALPFA